VRAVVGTGHVLTGTVRSARDCGPIAGARVELWPEIAGKGHPDDQRATVLTGPDGRYRFQSDPPEHIHMLVSADGFEPVASNRYHPRAGPPAASTWSCPRRDRDGWRVMAALG
jgi:protocatechuate 3,4-dioxygenase beta subunit